MADNLARINDLPPGLYRDDHGMLCHDDSAEPGTAQWLANDRYLMELDGFTPEEIQEQHERLLSDLESEKRTVSIFTPIIDDYVKNKIYFRDTDLLNLELYERLGNGRAVYISEFGRWHRWTGKVWQEDKQKIEPELIAQETIRAISALASATADHDKRKKINSWGFKSESEKSRRAMIAGAERSGIFVRKLEQFDIDDYLFNLQNGTLDLRTGNLHDHNPDDHITKISPCSYDPGAKSELWEDTVHRAMCGDSELIDFVQKYAGLTLTGDISQKILAFLYGSKGNNGKSTIVQTLLHCMGGYGKQISINTLMAGVKRAPGAASPDIMAMAGRRMIVADETESEAKFNDRFVKLLTGRDRISARGVFKDEVDFMPKMKIWLYGNDKPAIKASSTAMRNRLRMIPFDYVFQGAGNDPEAQDKLIHDHANAVFFWMYEGYRKFLEEGISEPARVTMATDSYFYEFNKLAQFIDEFLVRDQGGEIEFSRLYDMATDYLGWKMSKKRFSDTVRTELGLEVVAGAGNRRIVKGLHEKF